MCTIFFSLETSAIDLRVKTLAHCAERYQFAVKLNFSGIWPRHPWFMRDIYPRRSKCCYGSLYHSDRGWRYATTQQRNFVADFLQVKCDFTPKTAVLSFWASIWGLRGNIRWSS